MKKLLFLAIVLSIVGVLFGQTTTQLPTPTNIQIIENVLVWDEVENAIGYQVRIQPPYQVIIVEDATTNYYEIPEVYQQEGMPFWVWAVGDQINYTNSPPSDEIIYGTLPHLDTPQNLQLEGYTLSWDEVENADYYGLNLYPYVTGFPYFAYSNSCSLEDLPAGEYFIKVTAMSYNEEFTSSIPSEPFYFTIGEAIPRLATPTNLRISNSVLKWDLVENASAYRIYINTALTVVIAFEEVLNGFVIPEEYRESSVYFNVQALSSSDTFSDSHLSQAILYHDAVNLPPENLAAVQNENGKIFLAWSEPSGEYTGSLIGYKGYVNRPDDEQLYFYTAETFCELDLPEGNYSFYMIAEYSYNQYNYWSEPSNTVDFAVRNTMSENDEVINPISKLLGNYPNPFNPSTTINFSMKSDGFVNLEIFNVKGQKVRTLVNENKGAGDHQITWNGTDDTNKPVGSGIYFYRMTSDNFSSTKKMILMK